MAQQGQVTIVQDSSVANAFNAYKIFATEKRQVNGYRIQLASGSSRQTLMEVKARFLRLYPEMESYLEYHAPQFKLRVGNFIYRQEADRFVEELRKSFSSAFVVPDKILIQGVGW